MIDKILIQWFLTGNDLAMSGDTFDCHNSHGSFQWQMESNE